MTISPSKTRLKAAMRRHVNELRHEADKEAQKWRCDDPLIASTRMGHELHHSTPALQPKIFTNWREFTQVICVPIVESEDEDLVQDAMKLYRMMSPQDIASCLVIALNTVKAQETKLAEATGFTAAGRALCGLGPA